MNQQYLHGIADRRATGLGILNNGQGLVLISILIYIDMDDSSTCLNNRYSRILYDRLNQSRATTRNEQIQISLGLHHSLGGSPTGIRNQLDTIRRNRRLSQAVFQSFDNG